MNYWKRVVKNVLLLTDINRIPCQCIHNAKLNFPNNDNRSTSSRNVAICISGIDWSISRARCKLECASFIFALSITTISTSSSPAVLLLADDVSPFKMSNTYLHSGNDFKDSIVDVAQLEMLPICSRELLMIQEVERAMTLHYLFNFICNFIGGGPK